MRSQGAILDEPSGLATGEHPGGLRKIVDVDFREFCLPRFS